MPQAQHHLTEGQHHFERSENIIPHEAAQMNEVATSRKNNVLYSFFVLKNTKNYAIIVKKEKKDQIYE